MYPVMCVAHVVRISENIKMLTVVGMQRFSFVKQVVPLDFQGFKE
jgi:hypothetical protein